MMEIIGAILIILVIPVVLWDANNGFVVRWRRLGLLAAVLIGMAFLAAPVRAQHVHPDETIEDARVSKFYKEWARPPQRMVSCCHRKDCYSPKIRQGQKGLEYLHKWSGTWAPIPPNVIESNQVDPRESPNSESHICANENHPDIVYCATLGNGT